MTNLITMHGMSEVTCMINANLQYSRDRYPHEAEATSRTSKSQEYMYYTVTVVSEVSLKR